MKISKAAVTHLKLKLIFHFLFCNLTESAHKNAENESLFPYALVGQTVFPVLLNVPLALPREAQNVDVVFSVCIFEIFLVDSYKN